MQTIQKSLDKLYTWSVDWQMGINLAKCCVLHLGKNAAENDYYINGVKVKCEDSVRDLGVLMDSNLRLNEHINNVCTRAHNRVSLLFRGFISRDVRTMTNAYKIYVRPLLEYCSIVWSPWQIGLINCLENVQRYFTRRLVYPRIMPYVDRLAFLDLELLELRRMKFDMYYCFKIFNNLTPFDPANYFLHDTRNLNTRNYDSNLLHVSKSVNRRTDNFFINRCVPMWNSLTVECRTAKSLFRFKQLLNVHDFNLFLKGHI
jgi:hypothetical protein